MDIKVTKIGDSYGVFVDGKLFQTPIGEKEALLLAEFLRLTSAGEDTKALIRTGSKDLENT